MRLLRLTWICAFGGWACGSDASPSTSSDVADSAGIRIVRNHSPAWSNTNGWRLAPEPRMTIGRGGGDDAHQLFQVAGAVRIGETIAVANAGTHELRFYSHDGRLVSRIGGEGDGPGEFRRISKLQRVGNDSLAVIDLFTRRVTLFDAEGAFGRTVRLQSAGDATPVPVGVFADGRLLTSELAVARPPDPGRSRSSLILRVYAADGSVGDSVGVGLSNEAYVEFNGAMFRPWPVPFGRRDVTTVGTHRFAVGSMEAYEVRIVDASGSVRTIVRRSDPPEPITADLLDAEIARMAASLPEGARGPSALATLRAAGAPEHLPAFGPNGTSRYPPVTGIVFDAAGNLWVLKYPGPVSPSTSQWSVFDPSGRWLGDVTFPDGVMPLDIGEDFVVGHWRDELDVEYVGMYDLMAGRRTDDR